MRILHVIASVNPAGGGPIEGILRQDEALGLTGSREIVSCDPPSASFLRGYPLKVYPLGIELGALSGRIPIGRFGFTPRLVPWLLKHAAEYDAVVVNGLWNYASVAASLALPRLKIAYYVFTHGMLSPWFKRHHPLKHIIKQAFWLVFEGRLLSHASRVLFTTPQEQDQARGQFFGYTYHGEVVGYGTTAPRVHSKQKDSFRHILPGLGTHSYMLFLGRFHHVKGCDLLLEAFSRCADDFPDLHLVLAGPDRDGLQATLVEQSERLGIKHRVHWPGMLSGDLKWGALTGASAFVLPSHHENFGIVAAEALACGTPVLLTDKVAIWSDIAAAGAGIVSPDTAAGIEASIRQFCQTPLADQAQMRRAAKTLFNARYDLKTVANRILELMRAQSA